MRSPRISGSERIDRILHVSGLELRFLELSMERFNARVAKMEAAGEKVLSGPDAIGRYQQQSSQALRCMVLKNLISVGYREMSRQLAVCELYQWFCRVQRVPVVRAPSKSTLNDYAKWLPAEQMNTLLDVLTFLRLLEWQLMTGAGSLGFLWGDEAREELAGRMLGGGAFLAAPNPQTAPPGRSNFDASQSGLRFPRSNHPVTFSRMASDYDGAWKDLLHRRFPEILACYFPAVGAAIDWSQPPEFRD
jgi:hypothetical protein